MNGEATPAAPPNDLHLVARVKNQQGEEFGIKILARPGQSTQSILDVIGQYGYTLADPTSLQKELNPTEEGAVPKTAPEHEPFNIPGIGTMGDAAQNLAPLAFGLLTHSPAMARMAPRAMQTLRPMAQRSSQTVSHRRPLSSWHSTPGGTATSCNSTSGGRTSR